MGYVRADPELHARYCWSAYVLGIEASVEETSDESTTLNGNLACTMFLSAASGTLPLSFRDEARVAALKASLSEGAAPHSTRQNQGRRQAQASVAPDAAAVAAADAAMASLLAEEEADRATKAKRKSKKKRGGGAAAAATAYRSAAPADAHATDAADLVDDAAAALAAVHLHETRDPFPTPPAAAGARALSPTPAAAPSPVVYQPAAAPAVRMRECCVCLDDVAASDLLLMMPCGHSCVCAPCADMLAQRPPPDRRCPKCRNPFTGVTHVFEDDD
jgi:hypothetical protein